IKIAPSILASDFSRLGEEIKMIEIAGADYVHIDVMDGRFVPNITIGTPVVSAIKKITKMPLDVHLMIVEPDKYIKNFIDAGANLLCIHQEATIHLERSIQYIKSLGAKAVVSLNPATDINTLKYVLPDLDMVLVMSVNPGFGGQKYIQFCTEKIRILRAMADKLNPNLDIEVDGGITLDNIKEVVDAGANVIVAGSSIYKAKDPAAVISRMREITA
ncbi:MAG: ribulose-phosphate 3-epimerase, partial [Clostridiales bacterium]|nr:ribulose-phosphate 3-epimerase [Clostridiales bacterium]